jgi:hypothetical protein
MLSISACRSQRQGDLCEFKASLVYRLRAVRTIGVHRETLSQKKKKKKGKKQPWLSVAPNYNISLVFQAPVGVKTTAMKILGFVARIIPKTLFYLT